MLQMIGSAIQGSSANDWRSYTPSAHMAGADGPPGGSITQGGIGNVGLGSILTGASSLLPSGGPGYNDSTAGQIVAAQQGGGSNLGNLSRGVSLAGMAYGGLNKLTGGATSNAGVGAGLGVLGGGLQFIQGMERGGVQGYGSAAVGGLRAAAGVESLMGNSAMAGTLGSAAGYIAAPLAVYSAIKNWQSGNTGMDALQGAEAGAAVGSIIPGVGTLIGGVVGGLVGAASSAFGGGKSSQEAGMAWNIDSALKGASAQQGQAAINTMSPSQSFQTINGFMNAHDSSPGHSEQIQQVFGKNGVGNMMGQMLPAINSAISKNPQLRSLNEQQLYSQVIAPWLKSKGATIDPTTKDKNGNPEGQNLISAINSFVSAWRSGQVNSSSKIGNGGETLNMPSYAG